MYEMTTEIPFTRTGPDSKLKLHEAVGMMMDCCQFQEYQEQNFCRYLRETCMLSCHDNKRHPLRLWS